MLPMMITKPDLVDVVKNRIEAEEMLRRNFGGDQNRDYWNSAKELVSCWREYLELKEVQDNLGDWTTRLRSLAVIDRKYSGNINSFGNHLRFSRGRVKTALELFDRVASINGKEAVSWEWLETNLADIELCEVLERRFGWYARYHKAPVMLSKLV